MLHDISVYGMESGGRIYELEYDGNTFTAVVPDEYCREGQDKDDIGKEMIRSQVALYRRKKNQTFIPVKRSFLRIEDGVK